MEGVGAGLGSILDSNPFRVLENNDSSGFQNYCFFVPEKIDIKTREIEIKMNESNTF